MICTLQLNQMWGGSPSSINQSLILHSALWMYVCMPAKYVCTGACVSFCILFYFFKTWGASEYRKMLKDQKEKKKSCY